MTGAYDAHMTPSALASPQGGYFQSTRAPRYSIVFALPLLIAYEGLAALLSAPAGGLRNGADALFRSAFTVLAGGRGPAVVMAAVILLGGGLVPPALQPLAPPLRTSHLASVVADS